MMVMLYHNIMNVCLGKIFTWCTNTSRGI